MTPYIVNTQLRVDGRRYHSGDELTLSHEQAEELLACHAIHHKPIGTDPKDQAINPIIAAIPNIDQGNPAHWTRTGKPRTEILSELVGYPVHAADRDAAWQWLRLRKENFS